MITTTSNAVEAATAERLVSETDSPAGPAAWLLDHGDAAHQPLAAGGDASPPA